MRTLLAVAVALLAGGNPPGAAAGATIDVGGLICTDAGPLMQMIRVAEDSPEGVARIYMDEDLPRMPGCGIVGDRIGVTVEASKGTFELGAKLFHVLRVNAERTGQTLFILLPDDDLPGGDDTGGGNAGDDGIRL